MQVSGRRRWTCTKNTVPAGVRAGLAMSCIIMQYCNTAQGASRMFWQGKWTSGEKKCTLRQKYQTKWGRKCLAPPCSIANYYDATVCILRYFLRHICVLRRMYAPSEISSCQIENSQKKLKISNFAYISAKRVSHACDRHIWPCGACMRLPKYYVIMPNRKFTKKISNFP